LGETPEAESGFRPRVSAPTHSESRLDAWYDVAASKDVRIDFAGWGGGQVARPDGPVTVCVINLKGGVGKSTVAALLSRRGYTHRNLDVLAIDLDPQANLSQGLMHSGYIEFLNQKRPSIVEVFNGYVPPSPVTPGPTPLAAMSVVETVAQSGTTSLQLIPSRFDFSDNLLGAVRPDPRTLARFLSDNYRHKDLIIIDCAPTESILTTAAYHASGHVLVPVRPEYFATIGFPLLQQSLSNFRNQNRSHHISVCGVVLNNAFYDGGNNGGPEKKRALVEIRVEARKNSWPIYKHEIPHSRGFPKIMRGDYSYPGNAPLFAYFADEFFGSLAL
jgi:chromosome partitioning protein